MRTVRSMANRRANKITSDFAGLSNAQPTVESGTLKRSHQADASQVENVMHGFRGRVASACAGQLRARQLGDALQIAGFTPGCCRSAGGGWSRWRRFLRRRVLDSRRGN